MGAKLCMREWSNLKMWKCEDVKMWKWKRERNAVEMQTPDKCENEDRNDGAISIFNILINHQTFTYGAKEYYRRKVIGFFSWNCEVLWIAGVK